MTETRIERWIRAQNGNAIQLVRRPHVYEVLVNDKTVATHADRDYADQEFVTAVWNNRR